MKLPRSVSDAGSADSIDPAGSSDRRGWHSGKIKADRASEEVKSAKTKPPNHIAAPL
jgi:hypothetical protein